MVSSNLKFSAPYPCTSVSLDMTGMDFSRFSYVDLFSNDKSLEGFNSEISINNGSSFNIHVLSGNGTPLSVIPPKRTPKTEFNAQQLYTVDIGVSVIYRQCTGSLVQKGKKNADPQTIIGRKFTPGELLQGPIYITELNIILALENDVESIRPFAETTEALLRGYEISNDDNRIMHPFVFYCNNQGYTDLGDWVYVALDSKTTIRAPLVQVPYLPPGKILSRIDIIDPRSTKAVSCGINTTFQELFAPGEDGIIFITRPELGISFHFGFDLEQLRKYVEDPKNTEDELQAVIPDPDVSEDGEMISKKLADTRLEIETKNLKQENEDLLKKLNRVTIERDCILKEKSDLEKYADRLGSIDQYLVKKAQQEHDRREKKLRSRTSFVMEVIKIIGAGVALIVTLKEPLLKASVWLAKFLLRTSGTPGAVPS